GCGLTTSARALVTGSGAAACAATATAAASRYTSARAHAATVMGSDASEALSAPAAARVPRGGGAQPEQQQRARLRRGAGRNEGVLRDHADAQVAGPERGHHVVERLALLEEEVHGDFLARAHALVLGRRRRRSQEVGDEADLLAALQVRRTAAGR